MCFWNLGDDYDNSKIEGFGQKTGGERTEGGDGYEN